MSNTSVQILESRIDSINHAIAQMRKDATSATKANVEMAIEMLALPELAKVEAELAQLKKDMLAKLDLKIARMNVQIRNRSWQRREQNV